MHPVDVHRLHLGAHHEARVLGHHVHHRLRRPDHAAQGVDGRAVDHAGRGRAQLEVVHLLDQGQPPLPQLDLAVFEVAQLADGGLAGLGDQPHPLDGDLGDLAAVLGDGGLGLARLALQRRVLALQRQHPGELGQALAIELVLDVDLLLEHVELGAGGLVHRHQAVVLLLDLGLALAELGDFLVADLERRLELLPLGVQQLGDLGIGDGALREIGRKDDALGQIALGGEARLAGEDLVPLAFDDAEFAALVVAGQLDQDLALLDLVAVAHEDALDHAALGMLDDLAVALDLDHAVGDDRAGDLGEAAPGAEAHQHEGEGGVAEDHEPPQLPAVGGFGRQLRGKGGHDWAASWPMRPATAA